jgi:ankyrin repeat protein
MAEEYGSVSARPTLILAISIALICAAPGAVAGELHDAVRAHDTMAVEALLASGTRVDETDFIFGTPLHVAVSERDIEIAAILIANGADVEAVSEQQGSRALHLAAEFGDVPMLALLLDRGADIEARDNVSRTPLLRAVAAGHTDAVRLLLDRGTEADAREELKGRTPLMIASYNGRLDIVELLIERGADVNATDSNGESSLYFAAGQPSFSNAGGGALIEYLVAHGADLNAQNSAGLTPLAYADVRGFSQEIADVLRSLGATK